MTTPDPLTPDTRLALTREAERLFAAGCDTLDPVLRKSLLRSADAINAQLDRAARATREGVE